VNAAANIFVALSEASLLIMPFIPDMTTSELHAVLTGGFATMSGFERNSILFFLLFVELS
jgi:nucleoside permease NupC